MVDEELKSQGSQKAKSGILTRAKKRKLAESQKTESEKPLSDEVKSEK